MRDPFRNFNTYKIDPITEIRNAGIVTNGDVYWVSATTDSDHAARTDSLGKKYVKTGIQAAIDSCVADQNDYVMVIPQDDAGSWSFGTALDVNKDRLHLLSVGYTRAKGGYSTKIHAATGTSPDTEVVAITGNGAEVGGFEFEGTMGTHGGGTVSNGNMYIDADDVWVHDCFVNQNVGGLDESPVVKFGGTQHGNRFDNCHLAITGTGCGEAHTAGVVALSKAGKYTVFEDCELSAPAGSADFAFVVSQAGAHEWTKFKNCDFINNDVSFSPASAVIGSVTVDNPIIMLNCTAVACAQLGTDPSVYVAPVGSGTRTALYNPNIAVGTAALVAA